jgi:hypothetical protein
LVRILDAIPKAWKEQLWVWRSCSNGSNPPSERGVDQAWEGSLTVRPEAAVAEGKPLSCTAPELNSSPRSYQKHSKVRCTQYRLSLSLRVGRPEMDSGRGVAVFPSPFGRHDRPNFCMYWVLGTGYRRTKTTLQKSIVATFEQHFCSRL